MLSRQGLKSPARCGFPVDNFASCSFECARTADARLAAAAALAVLFTLFDAAAFRAVELAGLFAAADLWIAVRELVRFGFETFATAFFFLA